jgi:hypothetical protein
VLEGKSVPEIKTKFDDVYMMALKTNWTVWPAFQAVNFGLIPLPYRLPAQQGAGILWTVSAPAAELTPGVPQYGERAAGPQGRGRGYSPREGREAQGLSVNRLDSAHFCSSLDGHTYITLIGSLIPRLLS